MNSSQEEQCAVTDIKISNFTFTWTINNFSFNNKEYEKSLDSPIFCMADKKNYKWFLKLYPKGYKKEYKDFIALYLHLKAPINPSIKAKVILAVLNDKKKETNSFSFDYSYEKLEGYGFPGFIKESTLFEKKDDLLPDDKLTIICKVTVGLDLVENCLKDVVTFQKDTISLNSDLQSLFENKNMTDVILAAEGKEFAAHKTILAARSPIFLTMLQTDMQEKRSSRIEFADISIEILGEMIQYLYYGTVKNIKQNACDLMEVADKYDMKGLKLLCEEQFHRELSVNSATKLFILADRHNCDRLKPLILKFIITNAKAILKTVEFKKFEKDLPILIKEMMHAVV